MDDPFRDYSSFENKKNEKILCLNVTRTHLLCERSNLYECTRKYWRLNGNRAQNAELVFAVSQGYIVGVYKPTRWFLSEDYIGRWEFEGEEIEDVGKTSYKEFPKLDNSKPTYKKYYHKTSFGDYENEKMNDYDKWSDPYGDEQMYFDGWNRNDVESGLADAYETDLSTRNS